jgi:beta-galactosidase
VLSRKVGKGRITYIGAWLDDNLMRSAAEWMLKTSGVRPAFGPAPDGVEVCRRTAAGKEVFVVVNHTKAPQRVALPRPMRPVLKGGGEISSLELPARGVEVLQAAR